MTNASITFDHLEVAHVLGNLILAGVRKDARGEDMRQALIDKCLAACGRDKFSDRVWDQMERDRYEHSQAR